MKLSLTQICKDELDNLKRIYPLIKDHVDEWIVVVPPKDKAISFLKGKATVVEKDFTQSIEPEFIEKFQEYGLEVDKDYRLFNFAAARNASLEAATGDYVLWFDGDDTPIGLDNIKKFVEKHPETEQFDAVYDYYRDEEGNPISDHVRERVFINNGNFEWKGGNLGLIHETLLPKEGYDPLSLEIPEDIFRVEHNTDHVQESSLRNHVALLYEYLKTEGKDPRTTYYLGIEFFNRKMYDYCIKVMLEYVKVGGSTEDRFNAWLKIAEAYQMLNQLESSRNAYLEAQKEMPQRPDSYLGLGESYFEEEEWAKAVEFMMTGLQKKLPSSKQTVDKIRYTFRPSGYIAQAYLQLGKPKEAYEWFLRAAKLNPKHPWIKDHAPLFIEAKDLSDYVTSFVKLGQLSQKLYPSTLSKLAEVIPEELKDQELLMDFKWRYTKPKIWADNTIVYFCSSAFEDWGPESLEEGCGGSEEAVIQLTKQLVKLGWDVTVYNNCKKEAIVDGVKWVRYERFNPRDMFNVLVSWRQNQFLGPHTAVKKVLDLHDVPDPRLYTKDSLKDVKVFVKSQYHRSTLPHLEDDNFAIIPNGIDASQFTGAKKIKNNLVWTSSYDRGLQNLLMMWPEIKKQVPDATLDIAYGWNLYDSTPWGKNKVGQNWKKEMIKLFDQEGVRERGRLSNNEVAELYKAADVWAYPTNFKEIDCITATKAMAAGCVPITTNVAALKERNQGIMIEGEIGNTQVFNKFKRMLIDLLKDEDKKAEIRQKLNVAKYDWSEVAKQWDEEMRK